VLLFHCYIVKSEYSRLTFSSGLAVAKFSYIVLYAARVRTFSSLGLAMPKSLSPRSRQIILLTLLTLLASVAPSFAQDKILGG
jgi:hypothetical protein